MTATGGEAHYCGDPFSDFLSWHHYNPDYSFRADPVHALNTESMCRKQQSVPDLVAHWKGKTGFIVWEFGIGRDDCRFYWGETVEQPAADEHEKPFHGLVFADGHPWSTNDIAVWLGSEAYAKLPVYQVTYFRDTTFMAAAKTSITPAIDFDLKDEIGYGSPDTSIHLAKDFYSIRWTGEIAPPENGTSKLFVKSDGAVKVIVDGQLVINKAKGAAPEAIGEAKLAPGKSAIITVEYIHETGPASLHLGWISTTGKPQILFPVSHP